MAFMAINAPEETATMLSPELGSGHEAAHVHRGSRRRGGVAMLRMNSFLNYLPIG